MRYICATENMSFDMVFKNIDLLWVQLLVNERQHVFSVIFTAMKRSQTITFKKENYF